MSRADPSSRGQVSSCQCDLVPEMSILLAKRDFEVGWYRTLAVESKNIFASIIHATAYTEGSLSN